MEAAYNPGRRGVSGFQGPRERTRRQRLKHLHEAAMHATRFIESIQIHCPRPRAFEYTQDYGQRLVWDTFLREAVLLDGAPRADKGVKAWCVSWHGLGMETEYVSFNPPAVTAVKMTRGPWMFESFAGSWKFDEADARTTTVTFTYSFSLRSFFRVFTPMVKHSLVRNVRGRLKDLKARLESEERARR